MSKYTIQGVDRAGCTWEVDSKHDPAFALACLEQARRAEPRNHFYVYLTDDPEAGDVENQIMEELEEMR